MAGAVLPDTIATMAQKAKGKLQGKAVNKPDATITQKAANAVALSTPEPLATRVRGLSDRAIAWLFIAPTIILLLAINIFPLVWTVWLSFTNYRANRPNAEVENVGLRNYARVLTDPDTWIAMQTTANFVFWTILIQTVLGFLLAYLIDRKFRGHGFWTTIILVPMMLSPAVVGNFWKFLYQPQIGLFNFVIGLPFGIRSILIRDAGFRAACALGDRHRRYLDVDAVCDADLPCGPALHSRIHLRSG